MKKNTILLILPVYLLLFSWLTLTSPASPAVEVKHLNETTLSQDEGIIIERAHSFLVTEDNSILVIDSKAANIKIFDMKGKRISIFGRKGMGPNEFVRPIMSSYRQPFVAIVDFGRKTIFIYKRSEGNKFEFIQKFLCMGLGGNFNLIDDENILIAGDKDDKNRKWQRIYQYNFKKNIYDYILSAEDAYGFDSVKQFKKEKNEKLRYIGMNNFCDVTDDSIYMVWTGDIKVAKIDRKTRKINYFGEKTGNFVTPYTTSGIKKAFHQMNYRLIYKLKRNMSYVRYIFVSNSKKVGVVYVGPFKKDNRLKIMLQLYTTGGEYLNEFEILNAGASHHYEIYFYFRKDNNRLYLLDTVTSEEFDQFYRIHEYSIAD